jgi:hypothetical protein
MKLQSPLRLVTGGAILVNDEELFPYDGHLSRQ